MPGSRSRWRWRRGSSRRWQAACRRGSPTANAVDLRLPDGSRATIGPGALVEVPGGALLALEIGEDLGAEVRALLNAAGAWPDASLGEAHEPEMHLVPRLLRAAVTGEPFAINGCDYATPDGTCVRDYVHVMDLADAHVRAAVYLGDDGESVVCNIGSGQGFSNREVATVCAEVTGRQIEIVDGPRRPGDVPSLIGSYARAREVLGWTPTRDLHVMVEDAWRWHRLHPDGYGDR